MLKTLNLTADQAWALRCAAADAMDALIEIRDETPAGDEKSRVRKQAKAMEDLFQFLDRTEGKVLVASTSQYVDGRQRIR